jgi:hypothetical protein
VLGFFADYAAKKWPFGPLIVREVHGNRAALKGHSGEVHGVAELHRRLYEPIPSGLKAITALVVPREKIIKPLLAAAQAARRPRHPKNPTPLDLHYECVRVGVQGVFQELGLAA